MFVIGDEFTIPEKFQVSTHIFNDHEIEYLRVKLKNGTYKDFYPTIFVQTNLLLTVREFQLVIEQPQKGRQEIYS